MSRVTLGGSGMPAQAVVGLVAASAIGLFMPRWTERVTQPEADGGVAQVGPVG